ncbi:regulator of chromosome condensation 1/beta-lactamase-inhibitor protein II [Suillus clintonianus]|uniref:regulator of chromosome condensation 1/beta-lactamase-inhibitor protein II n=1 Tax=Suillus clintonianus TaxID=1904413 RepID=UPI001B86C112|nr:regulator of chromosome condensation 1/beta-lactamase-inhibitor protein II [Suillus clintonianus]KAG2132798.1 regulator of chromosome condensation 1/beta-lactamase-inhibitor protein II [Suillus clintonianus]
MLSDLPVEVLLDNLLPWLAIPDLIHLGETDHFFARLCNDETFWKRKLEEDFNFTDERTARISGWKRLYRGLRNPKTYVWGEPSKGRLGLKKIPKSTLHDVPSPAELQIKSGARIVSLSAAGWAFFALDSDGSVYVWGTLNGTSYALVHDGYSEPAKPAPAPLKLDMPYPTRSISCGRLHATSLDDHHHVWTFLSWGRPFRLDTLALDATSFDSTPAQVESGWNFSSVLTKSGDVYVWWPFAAPLKDVITARNADMDAADLKCHATEGDVIPCSTWELHEEPTRLPPLPQLPEMPLAPAEPVKLVKIAALESRLIGLTNHGHVLSISVESDGAVRSGGWEYLPNFSEVDKVQQHPAYVSSQLKPPQSLRITHISAQFQTFVAYSPGSSSVILFGSHETHADSKPSILPSLQNNDVISVVLGDYHHGALTSTGKLLTWGEYSRGALGLGDPATLPPGHPGGYRTEEHKRNAVANGGPFPPGVSEPAEVSFGHGEAQKEKMFCFAVTAAGWHMGALVIDLEPHTDVQKDNDEDEGPPMPGRFPRRETSESPRDYPREPGQWGPPIMPRAFRIGFAGRGAFRGGHLGRGRGF